MDFDQCLREETLILTECAVAERLRRRGDVSLHPSLFNTPLIYDKAGRAAMAEIYGQYRAVAAGAGLPLLLCAPTWRLDRKRLGEAGMGEAMNQDAVRFMRGLQAAWQRPESPLFVGGLIGPANDCYQPRQALSSPAAAHYHSWQIAELARAGVDAIIAQTIPALSEAQGLADLLAATGIPYLISFVINRRAELLDGTPLRQAVALIDGSTDIPPAGYMVNCAYPTFLCPESQPAGFFRRLVGIQANGSSRDHDQLEGAADLHQDSLEHWGTQMLRLHRQFGVKLLGGCCGTDDRYLKYLVSH